MAEDILVQLAAIRDSLEAELKGEIEPAKGHTDGASQPLPVEPPATAPPATAPPATAPPATAPEATEAPATEPQPADLHPVEVQAVDLPAVPLPPAEPAVGETVEGLTKRNAPCPCGSGKRFKHCHGQHQGASQPERLDAPHEIGPGTTVAISSVQIDHVEAAPAATSEAAQDGSSAASPPGDAELREFDDQQGEPATMAAAPTPAPEPEPEPEPEQSVSQDVVPPGELDETSSAAHVSTAMKMIVAGHVKVRNSGALRDLLAHRRRLLGELRAVSGITAADLIGTVLAEIALIEAGLAELRPPPGRLPENEWA